MPEYTYLLDTRLSSAQQNALVQIRDAAREARMTVFLAGGAVRDLTTGSSVRDLDFAVQGNALELQAALEARGGVLWGKHEASRLLFFWFPGSVRVEVGSTRSETFPKPGKPQYQWSGIVDDLHRRDFTANAMALSLNEGSYGLLLDPLNGVADIEARQLRLVSNYGFLEDPSRLVRAVRLRYRLGWQIEERTATRYENAKAENFEVISPFLRGYELEKIAAEDDALGAMKALEAEGWMSRLFPAWTVDSVDTAALEDLHRQRIQLLMQGLAPDLSAAHLEIMTAGMSAGAREKLKAMMVRPGLRAHWEGLDTAAKEFARLLTGKEAATPSATWKLFHNHPAEAVLWLAHSRKSPAVEAKFKNFFTVWPEAAKKVPIALMLEMRITPELPVYPELLRELFLQQIDGKLETEEQMRAFLETYSPPAPPPPVTLRRSRAKKSDTKGKRKGAVVDLDDEDEDEDERPSTPGDEDEDEEIAASDEDVDEVTARSGGAPEIGGDLSFDKLSFDKVDLGAVLGRIQGDGDDALADDEEEEDAAPEQTETVFAEGGAAEDIAPPAPLAKSSADIPEDERELMEPQAGMDAGEAGSPPLEETVFAAPAIESRPEAVPGTAAPARTAATRPVKAHARQDSAGKPVSAAGKTAVPEKKVAKHVPVAKSPATPSTPAKSQAKPARSKFTTAVAAIRKAVPQKAVPPARTAPAPAASRKQTAKAPAKKAPAKAPKKR